MIFPRIELVALYKNPVRRPNVKMTDLILWVLGTFFKSYGTIYKSLVEISHIVMQINRMRGKRIDAFGPEIYHQVKSISRIVSFFLILLVGCKGEVVVPQHLIGVWETPAPKYADRYMKFTEHTLIYGTGEGQEVSHEIEKIDMEQAGGGTLYTLHYRDSEGEKYTLTFTYSPDRRTIQMKNRVEIWEKSRSGGAG